jgi:hypothetical protein
MKVSNRISLNLISRAVRLIVPKERAPLRPSAEMLDANPAE